MVGRGLKLPPLTVEVDESFANGADMKVKVRLPRGKHFADPQALIRILTIAEQLGTELRGAELATNEEEVERW